MNDTINNTDSLIKRYSETIRRIHTVLSQLDTSSNQRDFNKYLYYICQEYDPSITMQYFLSVHKRGAPYYVPHRGIYRFKRRTYGLPTVQLPDGSASLRPLPHLRPATWSQMRPATWSQVRSATQRLNYGGGRVIEVSGTSTFLPLRKSRQVW